ncbi:sporulation protein YqfD [Clostridium cadaveris]|nr:sporulation protein YqfD [Clostridium cadaveris]MDM8310749.1 sporulation protein YqfD [Clostridium cadaveris]
MEAMKIKDSIKSGTITIEIQGIHPESTINAMWAQGIDIKNLKRINITTLNLDINIRDLSNVKEIAKIKKCKVRVLRSNGILYILSRVKNGGLLISGIAIFIFLIYYLSLYVWNINIDDTKVLSPYEVRQQLLTYGIKPGIKKSSINIYDLENDLKKDDDRIMWARARIEGGTLRIKIEEKQNPPSIKVQENKGDIIAKCDGQIVRLYTTSGSAVVSKGDIVKKGQVLIQGIQGKEGFTYETPAEGTVIAKTFYENSKNVKIKGVNDVRTGNQEKDIYLNIFGKKLYLKKCDVKYSKYDKIEESGKFLNSTIYYEVKEEAFESNVDDVVVKEVQKMEEELAKNLDKSSVVTDKIIDKEISETNVNIRTVFIVEQDIATH